MRFGRRSPLEEVARRQLDLFALDDAELLGEAAEAEEAWNVATRDHAEEAYGDYQLVVDAIADRLLEIRESYAATLADDAAVEYRAAFGAVARRRFPRYVSLLQDLDDLA